MAQKKRKGKTDKKDSNKDRPSKYSVTKVAGLVVICLLIFFFLVNNFMCDENNEETYYNFKKEGELTFTDSTGKEITKIDIEIADTDYDRQLGLMNRKSMEENQGMLFIFPTERLQSFWMLNTLFSLDMLFINSNKEIVSIHKNTTPTSQQSYPSSKPAIYVVEVVAGFTDNHNIKEGDKIYWIGTKINL
jgi:uncharacterized membrane protein (UPF0127 family)